MATITENIYTLASKQLLVDATLTLKGGNTVICADYRIDRSGKYEIETTTGDVELVDGWIMGTADAIGATAPSPKNGGKRKKVTTLG